MDTQAELAALRGEVVVLRKVLEEASLILKRSKWSMNPYGNTYENTEKMHERLDSALTATSRAAQLGALVEAALKRHKAKRAFQVKQSSNPVEITASWQEWTDTENAEDAAADAVLAMEAKT